MSYLGGGVRLYRGILAIMPDTSIVANTTTPIGAILTPAIAPIPFLFFVDSQRPSNN